MQYLTSVLNEWGQFVTTVVVAAESDGCYARMARGLVARFKRANAPAPRVIYADNNCCRYIFINSIINTQINVITYI